MTTSTYTGGDSGFAESSNFLKVSLSDQQESHDHDQASAQAPYSSGQPEAEESSDGGYAPLNMEAVHASYYKSLHRQGIQGNNRYYVHIVTHSLTYTLTAVK